MTDGSAAAPCLHDSMALRYARSTPSSQTLSFSMCFCRRSGDSFAICCRALLLVYARSASSPASRVLPNRISMTGAHAASSSRNASAISSSEPFGDVASACTSFDAATNAAHVKWPITAAFANECAVLSASD